MRLRNCMTLLLFVLAVTAFVGVSRADILSGCGTCQGSTYLLQYNPTPVGTYAGGGNIYDVFLTIDTSGYNGGGSYIDSVLVKISNSVDLPPSSLVAAPGGTGSWTLTAGGLNAGGCQISGDSGALCAQDGGQNAPVGGTLQWEFQYATTDPLLLGSLASDIKARYVDGSGNKVGALVSEGITLQSCTTDCGGGGEQGNVPEPSSIALLGSLAVFAGTKIRNLYRNA